MSHPVRVRGLKHGDVVTGKPTLRSHPVRVRGLKRQSLSDQVSTRLSHPVRVRGLKRAVAEAIKTVEDVAPRAGAWVETPGMIEI